MGSKIQTKRSWFLIVFGSFFAAPTLYMLIAQLAMPLYDTARMQFWQQTEAKLLSSDVKSYHGDSTTYEVIADYTYQVNGRTYEGDRVSIHSGSDNIGDYHQDMGRMLSRSDNLVTIYYNPDKPQQSIIDRSMRWGMAGFITVFSALFGMVGVGAMWFGWRGNRRIVSAETTDKPWLSNPEWVGNNIKSDAKVTMYVILFMSVFWNLITWPVFLFGGKDIYKEVPFIVSIILLIFPAVGLYLIYLAAKAVKQSKKFGKTPLTLTPFPGSIGGQVGGKIVLNNTGSELHNYEVNVVCARKYYSGSGKNRSLKEQVEWECHTFANYCDVGAGRGLEFCVDVPEGLPESDIDKTGHWHEWRVDVECTDIKFERSFEIPVYQTQQQSEVSYQVPQYLTEHKQSTNLNTALPITEQGDEVRIQYPMFYKPAFKVVMVFAALFLQGILAALSDDMPTIMYWIFFTISALLLVFSVKSLVSSLTVVIKSNTLEVSKGILGITTKRQKIPFSQIEEVKRKEVMRSQNGQKQTVHFKIEALLATGEKVCIAKSIDGEPVAKTAEGYFREKLGLADVVL